MGTVLSWVDRIPISAFLVALAAIYVVVLLVTARTDRRSDR